MENQTPTNNASLPQTVMLHFGIRLANCARLTRPAVFCRGILTPSTDSSDKNSSKVSFASDRTQRILSTLNPSKLRPEDYLDLSGPLTPKVTFPYLTSGAVLVYRFARPPRPFPSNSRGFLYYFRDPLAAPLEGSIRFRLTPDDTPLSFNHGHDLRVPSGMPWQLILPQISTHMSQRGFCDQLLHEKLVTQEQLSECTQLVGDRRRWVPSLTLFRLCQEFPIHFEAGPAITLTIVSGTLHQLHLPWVFGRLRAWSGSGIARFEPSISPANPGKRIVHIRIVKITEPVVCVDEKRSQLVYRPVEGQLVMLNREGAAEPWAYDIERETTRGAALRALWDVSPSPFPGKLQSGHTSLSIDSVV
ncbi:hypothetical protein B0H16DRAFT_1387704 [Mycena metata]|uniref:Uncharacterized protein n=1 Tax=Mycena metata TaxID=1033252 RepID=A0AAD7MI53_9AGAR|nr:hypothetical protein B0H16DRAFT_1387704 [Mycena metata]